MSSPASNWFSFWEHNLLEDHQHPEGPFISLQWSNPICAEDEASKSASFIHNQLHSGDQVHSENSKGDSFNQDNRKRVRADEYVCTSGAQGKACREKMRRDRMNDRFLELATVLEPDKPPKTDKASILRDAARIISQLRTEREQLKETNMQLQETITELKSEKNELRGEKLSLKMEKESLEKKLKSVQLHPSYAAQALYSTPQSRTLFSKPPEMLPFATTMSQWIPPEVADVSNDHVLRPPVA